MTDMCFAQVVDVEMKGIRQVWFGQAPQVTCLNFDVNTTDDVDLESDCRRRTQVVNPKSSAR